MSQATAHRYIVTDDRILSGEPIIKDTRTPVRAIVDAGAEFHNRETLG